MLNADQITEKGLLKLEQSKGKKAQVGYDLSLQTVKQIRQKAYGTMKQPNEIKISTIIRILEGPIAMLPCVSLNYYEKCDDCTSEERCSLNRLMVEVRDNTLKILENKTLEDFHCGT